MQIFISRDLPLSHPLRRKIEERGHRLQAQSLIHFEYVPFNYFPTCHWVFFYSPRAVRFFLDSADPLRYRMSRFAVMGNGTAAALIERGIVPDFIGNGNPEQTAESFAGEAYEMRVLFPQASNSRQSVEKYLDGQAETISLVVYDNLPKDNFNLAPCDVLIFTSPLNVQAFLSKYPIAEHQKVIAIGDTTAGELRKRGVYTFAIASRPDTAGILELLD